MVQELNPQYAQICVTGRRLSGPLLVERYQGKKTEIDRVLAACSNLAVITDAFTDQNQNSLVNTYATPNTTQKPIYCKTINTQGNAQTAAQVASDISDTIETLGREKVDKVVTDTCNTMKASWALLEARYPHLNCYGCAAHVLNLLIKDIVKSVEFNNLIAQNEKIVMFIRNHTALNHLYSELMSEFGVTKKLTKAVPTRWLSTHTSLQNTHDAKDLIKKMAVEHSNVFKKISSSEFKAQDILKIILNENFWKKLATCVAKLKLPSLLIQRVEADNSSTEIVYGVFISLYEFYGQRKDKRAQKLVMERFQYISCDLIKAAHMLNHIQAMSMKYMVINGVSDDINCLQALRNQALKFGGNQLQQRTDVEIQQFHAHMRNVINDDSIATYKSLTSTSYWEMFGNSRYPALYELTKHLFGSASSAPSERGWSCIRLIHTRLRNRLSQDKIDKILFLKVNSAIDDVDFDHSDYEM